MSFPRLDSHGLTTLLTRLASDIRQGHIIKRGSTVFTQRKNLQLEGAKITDDSTNDTTKVEFYYEYPTLAAAQADIANIPEGARVIVKEADYVGQIDNALSLSSVNPVQNKVVTAAISGDVLWENNGASTVASTTFTVDLSKYKSLKLITQDGVCECATSGATSLTGCLPSIWYSTGSAKMVGYTRFLNVSPSAGTVNISDCKSISDGTTNNTRILPLKVVGYTT